MGEDVLVVEARGGRWGEGRRRRQEELASPQASGKPTLPGLSSRPRLRAQTQASACQHRSCLTLTAGRVPSHGTQFHVTSSSVRYLFSEPLLSLLAHDPNATCSTHQNAGSNQERRPAACVDL